MSAQRRLKAARRKRRQVAAILKMLRDGRITLPVLLETTPDALGSVRIYTLLLNAPGLGESGVRRVLERSKVYAADRVGALTVEQKSTIIRNLPPRAKSIQ